MNSKQKKALRTLFGDTIAEVIEAWCNITQEGETLQWMHNMLVEEISECWDGDISEYPDANYRDKLTLDRFFSMGLFDPSSPIKMPSQCPNCHHPVVEGEPTICSLTGYPQQPVTCSNCEWETLLPIVDSSVQVNAEAVAALDDWDDD